jgi:hypothetical protein
MFYAADMDWARAIAINQSALTRIVAALIAMLGLAAQGAAARLPRPLYRRALSILRPAESAVRRLIVIAAKGVVVKPHAVCPMRKGLALAKNTGARASFQLFDSRKRFGSVRVRSTGPKTEPRVFVFGESPFVPLFQPREERGPEPENDDGTVNAQRLSRRLAAIKMALENLPRQVKRLKRWQARRYSMRSPKFRSPLRPGLPPGHRKEPRDEVDRVLRECHALASDAFREDSS